MDRQEEVNTKLQRVRTWLETAGLEGIVLTSQANFAWLTGGGSNYVYVGDAAGEASLLVTRSQVYLLTNNIELQRLLEEEVAGLPFQVIQWKWHQMNKAKELVAELCKLSRTVSDLGSLGLPPASSGFTELRYTMLPPEIERYRCLGLDAAQSVEAACFHAKPGDAELDVAASLAFECQKRNILPLVNLVAGDERIARYRHPLPTKPKPRWELHFGAMAKARQV